ncbi:FixH family protein [Paenibacillus sp. NPDC056579]|uniref:FixH family protein n=1 Tax=unclassified Paenibacillus TaxID=185978 RepID=UPI001EF7DFE8|nr:FixH family protein [Paenibacillus sp. H1-7]ULL18141.1 hypothetical protein DVH26_28975 [Paenibacillus sp. H1-7]
MDKTNLLLYGLAGIAAVLCGAWLVQQHQPIPDYKPVSVFTEEPYTFEVKMNTDHAVVLKPNGFTVEIRQADQRPVSGAAIDITLSMPDMFCGTSTVKASEVAPGIYHGDGIPLMAGASTADVKVSLNGHTYSMQHPFWAAR